MNENYEGLLRREKEKKVILRGLRSCLKKIEKSKGSFLKKRVQAHRLSFEASNHLFEFSKVLIPVEWFHAVLSVGDRFLEFGMVDIARRQFYERVIFEMTLIDYKYPSGAKEYIVKYTELQLQICKFYEILEADPLVFCPKHSKPKLLESLQSIYSLIEPLPEKQTAKGGEKKTFYGEVVKEKRIQNCLCVYSVFEQSIQANLPRILGKLSEHGWYEEIIPFVKKTLVFVEEILKEEEIELDKTRVLNLASFYGDVLAMLWVCMEYSGVEMKEFRNFIKATKKRVGVWVAVKKKKEEEVEDDMKIAPMVLTIDDGSGNAPAPVVREQKKVVKAKREEVDVNAEFFKVLHSHVVSYLERKRVDVEKVESCPKKVESMFGSGGSTSGESSKKERKSGGRSEVSSVREQIENEEGSDALNRTTSTISSSIASKESSLRYPVDSGEDDGLKDCLNALDFLMRGKSIFEQVKIQPVSTKKSKKSKAAAASAENGEGTSGSESSAGSGGASHNEMVEMGLVNDILQGIMSKIDNHLECYEEDLGIVEIPPVTQAPASPVKKKKKKKKKKPGGDSPKTSAKQSGKVSAKAEAEKKKKKKKEQGGGSSTLREGDRYKTELPDDFIFSLLRYGFHYSNSDIIQRLLPIVKKMFPGELEVAVIDFLVKYTGAVEKKEKLISARVEKPSAKSSAKQSEKVEEKKEPVIPPTQSDILSVHEAFDARLLFVLKKAGQIPPRLEVIFREGYSIVTARLLEYFPSSFAEFSIEVLLAMFRPLQKLSKRDEMFKMAWRVGRALIPKLEERGDYSTCLKAIRHLLSCVVLQRNVGAFVGEDKEETLQIHSELLVWYYRLSVKNYKLEKGESVRKSIEAKLEEFRKKNSMQEVYGKPFKKDRLKVEKLEKKMKRIKITNIVPIMQTLKEECGVSLPQLVLLNLAVIPFQQSKEDKVKLLKEAISIIGNIKENARKFKKYNDKRHLVKLLKGSDEKMKMVLNPNLAKTALSDCGHFMIFGKEKTLQNPFCQTKKDSNTPISLNDMFLLGCGVMMKKGEEFYVKGLKSNKFYSFQIVGVEDETGLVSGGLQEQNYYSFATVLPIPQLLLYCRVARVSYGVKCYRQCFECVKAVFGGFDIEKILQLKKEDELAAKPVEVAVEKSPVKEKKKRKSGKKKKSSRGKGKVVLEEEPKVEVELNRTAKYIKNLHSERVFKEILSTLKYAKKMKISKDFVKEKGYQCMLEEIEKLVFGEKEGEKSVGDVKSV